MAKIITMEIPKWISEKLKRIAKAKNKNPQDLINETVIDQIHKMDEPKQVETPICRCKRCKTEVEYSGKVIEGNTFISQDVYWCPECKKFLEEEEMIRSSITVIT